MTHRALLAILAGALGAGTFLAGGTPRPPAGPPAEVGPPGRPVEDFTLPDFRGRPHSLGERSGSKAVVVVFLGTGCPLANLYGPRLAELAYEFMPRGVS